MFKKLLKSKNCPIFVVVILSLIAICLLINFKMIPFIENFTDSGSDVSGSDVSSKLIDYSGLSSPVGKLDGSTLVTPQPLVCSDC